MFWWRGVENFGDVLGREILEKISQKEVEWTPAPQAEIIVIGSIATMMPLSWNGTVAGIGWARPDVTQRLQRAEVLALRGRLSIRQLGRKVPAAGDPGLLSAFLIGSVPQTRDLGIVAHWQDHSLDSVDGFHIDVHQEPLEVVRQIASCKRILSSSLHGLIVADSFGIERRWHRHAQVQGGGFKFLDYGTVVGVFAPGSWDTADRQRVKKAQNELLRVFWEMK